MTPADVRKRVEYLFSVADDPEEAHCVEKRIWRDVLSTIAHKETDEPAECARVALQTMAVKFPRWYA